MSVLLVLAAVVSKNVVLLRSQDSAAAHFLSFEVASVRSNAAQGTSTLSLPPRGTVRFIDAPLDKIIALAFGIEFSLLVHKLVGGDHQLLSRRYDIIAKPPEDAPPGENRLMLRRLLAERFKLRIHQEERDVQVYAISVARNGRLGPSLRRSEIDCDTLIASGVKIGDPAAPRGTNGQPLCWSTYGFNAAGPGTLTLKYSGAMATLVRFVQPEVDRPLIDTTGLHGNFDWTLTFRYQRADERAQAPLLFDAFEQQLGLRLIPRRAPYPVWVIDSVEPPTPN
jgi:uncharacterized protein (TIGR03435 family)